VGGVGTPAIVKVTSADHAEFVGPTDRIAASYVPDTSAGVMAENSSLVAVGLATATVMG
jgi:hypothetical protein